MRDTFSLARRLAAEALGTALLVARVVGSGIMADKLAGGNVALALFGNTIPTGAILVVLILSLGPISGAHFNPAVSLVMRITGALAWREVGAYAVAQTVGGCLGTFAAHGMFELPLFQLASTARTGPALWFAEFVATFGLLVRIDVKKIGRFHQVGHRITGDRTRQSSPRGRGEGAGWSFVHVCLDDASRIAFTMIMPNEKAVSAVPFLKAAVAYYQSLGIPVARVMTDNGSCYKASAFARACRTLNLKHIRTKPYTPKTNGKAERFIQTALREWAYARPYNTSQDRAPPLAAVDPRLQLAPTPRQPKRRATHQSPKPDRGQPVEAPHLVALPGEEVRVAAAPLAL